MYIDAHCHLSDLKLKEGIVSMVTEARSRGITGFLMAGLDSEDWHRQLDLKASQSFPGSSFFPVFGLHPWIVIETSKRDLEGEWKILRELAGRAVAIGETGLDFHRDPRRENKTRQIDFFERHLSLAEEFNKPVVIHSVKAHEETLKVLNNHTDVCGLVHDFRSSDVIAGKYRDRGFLLSYSASALVKSPKLQSQYLRFNSDAVLETDAPNVSPQGPDNSLLFLIEAAKALASRSEESEHETLQASSKRLRLAMKLEAWER